MKFVLALGAAWLVATTAACSSDCRGKLSEIGATCPTTFDGTFDHVRCRDSLFQYASVCPGASVFSEGGGYGGVTCYYDSSSHQLIGAKFSSDIPEYCDDSSHDRSAGRTPEPRCEPDSKRLERTCPWPDAGAR